MGIMSVSETGTTTGDPPLPPDEEQQQQSEISEISEPSPDDERRLELPADRYLDREQSWVKFNQRVLELAEDDQTPLLERVRFLAIFASNLDEFFMVRVAGLMRRMAAGLPLVIPSGRTPDELLKSTLA